MAVKIRMTRMGRRHRPFFRINAVESRNPRDGKVIEKLGHYDPLEKDQTKQVVLNKERIQYWLDQGAVASETVSEILARHGIKSKHAEKRVARRAKARELAAKQGKFFTKAQKIAAEKVVEEAAAKAKAEAEAAKKAEEEKAKAKEEAAKAKEEEAAKKAEEEKAKAEAEAAKKAEKEQAKAEAEEAKKAEEAKAEPEAPQEAAEAEKTEAPAEATEKAEEKAAEPEKTEAAEKPAEAEAAEEADAKEDKEKAKE